MKPILFIVLACLLFSCSPKKRNGTVLAIPVYGQSLALGEEAIRITNFDTLVNKCNHHVLTENLDEKFGYYSEASSFRQWLKKVLDDKRRSFELSVYGMSEVLCDYFDKKGFGDSLLICTFPGGQGATGINDLSKGSKPYNKFLEELKDAYETAKDQGLNFVVPAFCWMQGEDDVVWNKSKNYKEDLKKFHSDFNEDVKSITKQKENVVCVCYQTNCITLSKKYTPEQFSDYNCDVTAVPQAQMELVQSDPFFMASGPVYPYSFAENERVHPDGLSQKRIGYLAGLSIIRLIEQKESRGLTPSKFSISGDTVIVNFNVPAPPLALDTISVWKVKNYGFNVINAQNEDILEKVIVENNRVKLYCSKSPVQAKIRYAVNGEREKSGYRHGARGNLRDSQGEQIAATIINERYPLHNWCFQFDIKVD